MDSLQVKRVKSLIKERLESKPVTLIFEKADGTLRTMQATLDSRAIRYEPSSKQNPSERKSSDDVLAVWDIHLESWRSFRWDRLKEVDDDMTFPYGVVERG